MAEPSFRPALLVVDMQEDFCPPNGSLAVPQGRTLTPLINHLLTSPVLALRVATQDWHPPNHISFAPNHPGKIAFVDTTTIAHPLDSSKSYSTRLWPVHCVQDTPGASLLPELSVDRFDSVIRKGTDPRVEMYSAFYDPLKVSVSELSATLRNHKITHVYVVGLAGDYCVRSTAVDASAEGYETFIIEEGTKCVDPGGWEVCKQEIEGASTVRIVSADGPEVGRLFPPSSSSGAPLASAASSSSAPVVTESSAISA